MSEIIHIDCSRIQRMTEADNEGVAAFRGGIEEAIGRGRLVQLLASLSNDESIRRHVFVLGLHHEVEPIREHLAKHVRRAHTLCGWRGLRLDVVPLAINGRAESRADGFAGTL